MSYSDSENGEKNYKCGNSVTPGDGMITELRNWKLKEKDLDEEIKGLREALNKEPVVTDKDIMEQLHLYNDMKDAAQVVLGSLARIEEVSFTEIHRRYNLELSDGP